MEESTTSELQKVNLTKKIAKIAEAPISIKSSVILAIDRVNAEARIEILKANQIIKHGLLHKKKDK